MWNLLRKTDFERAKVQLALRLTEMMARHLQELQALDAKQTELKTLNDLIEGFAQKFGGLVNSASEPSPGPPISDRIVSVGTALQPRPHHHREPVRTNFDTFARAFGRG